MLRPLLILVICTMLASCGASRQATREQELPAWVQNRPLDDNYYYGLGSSRISQNQNIAIKLAKEKALSDLISEISVEVSARSVLNQLENNDRLSEEFRQNISLKSGKSIEGYEVYASHSDGNTMWVMYRLNKFEYQERERLKKQKSIELALEQYQKAKASVDSDLVQTLFWSIKSLESIRDYLNEPLLARVNDSSIYLGNEIIDLLSSSINSISIRVDGELSVIRGQELQTTFILEDGKGHPVPELPLYIRYSGVAFTQRQYTSDKSGQVPYRIKQVKSRRQAEEIRLSVDLERISSTATKNNFVKRLVTQFQSPEKTLQMFIEDPVIVLSKGLDNRDEIGEALRNKGFKIGSGKGDYRLTIKDQKGQLSKDGNFSTVIIRPRLVIYNTNGDEVLNEELGPFKSSHTSAKVARQKANQKLLDSVERSSSLIKDALFGNEQPY